jgi:hypothetical protein
MKTTVKWVRIYFVAIGLFGIAVTIGLFALTLMLFFLKVNPQCNLNLMNSECLRQIAVLFLDPFWILQVIVPFGLAGAYLYIGIDLRRLLVKSPKLIRRIIFVNIACQVLSYVISSSSYNLGLNLIGDFSGNSAVVGFSFSIPLFLCISICIDHELLDRVKYLAQEERSKKPFKN